MKKICPLAFAGLFALSVAHATVITEDFSANPLQNGWQVFGNTNLFQWNSTNQNLEVTWDSSQPNSYFYHPLGTILTRNDDFSIEFDLRLSDIASGVEPGKTGPMEIGIGFLNLGLATGTNFMRGSWGDAPDVAEFDYFPDGYYDYNGTIYPAPATATPAFIPQNAYDLSPTLYAPFDFEFPTGQIVHVTMTFTASNQTVVTTITTNGVTSRLPDLALTDPSLSAFTDSDDFRVDTFSVTSYSNTGDPYDSVLAHGFVGNIVVTVPSPPVQNFNGNRANNVWQGQFISQSNWLYTLERTADFQSWTNVSVTTFGVNGILILSDTNALMDRAFYRVRAERP
jgi:hypothetical protein